MTESKDYSCKLSDILYSKTSDLVLGFHGCSIKTHDAVLFKGEKLIESRNRYDWLGHGIYFWENSYERAYEWALEHYKDTGEQPAVIGAVIDLGHCLNLTECGCINIMKSGYNLLKQRYKNKGLPLPENKDKNHSLDCAVIQEVHNMKEISPFDSVRGLFLEGRRIYKNSNFLSQTHVQICVVNPNCIKGYFEPIEENPDYQIP